MKKLMMLFAFTIALLIGLTACDGDSGGTTDDGRVVLTGIVLKHPLTQPNADMEWLQLAEERAGVSIQWEEISSDWDEVKGTLLASGDIPDIIIGAGAINNGDFAMFPGLFEDFRNHMDALPNVQAMFDEQPLTYTLATQADGSILGLSKYQRFWPETVTRQYINQVWLDNLGLDIPTNWDELFDVLIAFRDNDANGSGRTDDEIPMDFNTGFGFFSPAVLLANTGITITDSNHQGYFAENGRVLNYFADPRYKEFIQFLHRCFAEGLINPEVFTQDYTRFQAVARGEGDYARVGFTFGWVSTDRFGNQVAPQYVSIPPLRTSATTTVDPSWTYDFNTLNFAANVVTMSARSNNHEAALAFINELYDPVVGMQILFGSLGTNISDNSDGSFSVLPPVDPDMDPGTWKWTSTWADNGPMFISDTLDLSLGEDMALVLDETLPLRPTMEAIGQGDILPMMFMNFTSDENNTMAINNTNIMSIAESHYARWITQGGIEDEWEEYLELLERAGLNENLEIIQRHMDLLSN